MTDYPLHLESKVAILEEQHEEHNRRISDIQQVAKDNTSDLAQLTTDVSKLSSTVELLSKIVFGCAALILVGFMAALIKVVMGV